MSTRASKARAGADNIVLTETAYGNLEDNIDEACEALESGAPIFYSTDVNRCTHAIMLWYKDNILHFADSNGSYLLDPPDRTYDGTQCQRFVFGVRDGLGAELYYHPRDAGFTKRAKDATGTISATTGYCLGYCQVLANAIRVNDNINFLPLVKESKVVKRRRKDS